MNAPDALQPIAGEISGEDVESTGHPPQDSAPDNEQLNEKHLRLILDHAADAILIAGKDRFCYANRQATQLLGYSIAELCERGIFDITLPEDVARH